jgi:hypothetical protein
MIARQSGMCFLFLFYLTKDGWRRLFLQLLLLISTFELRCILDDDTVLRRWLGRFDTEIGL